MKVEISRRRFLQGTVALIVSGGAALEMGGRSTAAQAGKARMTADIPTLCEMCVNKCAAIAHVRDGVVTKLDPNPWFPKSRNMLCARGAAGIQALYDPDRLKYPLIRSGQRGDGHFRRVSWEEAFAFIRDRLVSILKEEKDNRSCIGYCAGEGLAEHTFKSFMADKFGSSNFLNHSTICLQSAVSGFSLTLGSYGLADLENAKYVIMAGANRAEALITPDSLDLFKRTRGRGTKLVVIDPRYTKTAIHADRYIPIRPGTDLALVLALTYVAIKGQLYNKEYVANNFQDFERYSKHILQSSYTPEWAAKLTGIPVDTICQVAHEFMAAAPQAIYYQGRRSTWAKNDFQLRRAMAIFTAMGGGVDVKGGIIFGSSLPLGSHSINAPIYANARSRIDKDAAAVIGDTGSWVAWRNMVAEGKTPYPIRGMFVYKQNPMRAVPDSARTRQMFERMDLVVVIDTMPSDTAMMADVILPECTYLEREDPLRSFPGVEPVIALRRQVIPPLYDSKPVIEIMRGLGTALTRPLWDISRSHDEDLIGELADTPEEEVFTEGGYDLAEPYMHSQEELNREMFVGSHGEDNWQILRKKGVFYPSMTKGFSRKSPNTYTWYPPEEKRYSVLHIEDRPKGDTAFSDFCASCEPCVNPADIAPWKRAFKTPSGKIECVLASMEKRGVDAMPTWHDEDYVTVPRGKFKFITGRHAQHTQSSTQNNVLLLELMHENYAWINDQEALRLDIAFGDLIEVSSPVGTVRLRAYPTAKILPELLFFIHGFGIGSTGMSLASGQGANDNEIIEGNIEPVLGCAIMHDTLVTVKKVLV